MTCIPDSQNRAPSPYAWGCDGLGLYVHIPYCRSVCPYCDFNSYVVPSPPWERFAAALEAELRWRALAFPDAILRTIYFGGGTPSLAPVWVIERVLAAAADVFGMDPVIEVTVEANPGSVDVKKFRSLAQIGVNRVSLGWQSTHDELLRVLGRGHSATDGRAAFDAARRAGFDNVSVDLIFAVPGQTTAELASDLEAVRALAPEHVSLYALTYHEGTPYFRWLRKGRLRAVDEPTEVRMMDQIETALCAAGFEHYEISNYARVGRHAIHNSAYWTGVPYLGIGPGAHSFWRKGWCVGRRWESLRAPEVYVATLCDEIALGAAVDALPEAGTAAVVWCEHVDAAQMLSERMLCGLRMRQGVCLQQLREAFGHSALATERLERGIVAAVDQGWAESREGRLVATQVGFRMADSLAALFF